MKAAIVPCENNNPYERVADGKVRFRAVITT
jgi:hypothetical protein